MKKKTKQPVVLNKKKAPVSEGQRIKNLLRDKATVILDLGCGGNKRPGAIGVDFRKMDGVDIEQDLSLFPWRALPDECADVLSFSHVWEHINPVSPDPRLAELIDLLVGKKLVTKEEIEARVGDYRFLGGFLRFMDECWRITKPGGQIQSVFPFGGSPGYWQDPTHVNPITHVTLAYLDPLAKVEGTEQYYGLYQIYRTKPWKIVRCMYDINGFMEVCLEKRPIDKSYHVSEDGGLKA